MLGGRGQEPVISYKINRDTKKERKKVKSERGDEEWRKR